MTRFPQAAMLAAAVSAGCASSGVAPVSSPYETTVCPIPQGVRGYPLVVRAERGAAVEPEHLAELANSVGGYIELPTSVGHTEVVAVVGPEAVPRAVRLDRASGDAGFDRGALAAVRRTILGADEGLRSAVGPGDSLSLRFLFGVEPRDGEPGFRRLSAQWRLPVLQRTTVLVPPELANARVTGTLRADIAFLADGTAGLEETGSMRATNPRLAAAAPALAAQLRFTLGSSDCEPQSYVLPVEFTLSAGSTMQVRIIEP